MKNCMSCTNYLRCKDPARSVIYVCDRYSVSKASLVQEASILSDLMELPLSSFTDTRLPTSHQSDPYESFGGFDAFDAISKVLEDKRIVSPDIKIPEGDFAEAPNFLTWCMSHKFLNQKPFAAQALYGTLLFAEHCMRCSDTDYLFNGGLRVDDTLQKFEQKVALFEHGKCPHCGKTRLDHFKHKKSAPYWELALSCGQRSGKSALVGMLTSYLTHRFIKLERPNEVFGLLKATVLQGTFVALTYAQAKDTLWEPYYGNLLDSPWFQEYHGMLTHVEGTTGEELLKLKDTFVNYKHRRLMVYPAGPDKRVLRGRTRFFGGIDELGWFPNDLSAQTNVKMNANEVYIALERSLLTVRSAAQNVIKRGFYNVPYAYFINVSSPSSVRDKIMELVRKSQGSRRILGACRPTWEMNPHVPKSALAEEFKKDPEAAMRDYGAQPPLTNSPFINSGDKLVPLFGKKQNPLKIIYKVKQSKDSGASEMYAVLDEIAANGKPSVLALDAGYSNNSFAFAIGHRNKLGLPTISVVGEIIPTPGIRINHSLLYTNLISQLFLDRNIVIIGADRWNSLKILADAEEEFGCTKVQYSLKYADIQLLKSYIEDEQIQLPKPTKPITEILKYDHATYPLCFKNRPADHLMLQLLTVQDTGSAVIKGDQLTDDVARAVMLCFKLLIDENNDEELNGAEEVMQGSFVDIKQMAVSRNYSGGGSSNSGGGGGSGSSSLGISRTRQ